MSSASRVVAPKVLAWDANITPPELKKGPFSLPEHLHGEIPKPVAHIYIGNKLTGQTAYEILRTVSQLPPKIKGLAITVQQDPRDQNTIISGQIIEFLRSYPAAWATWILHRKFCPSTEAMWYRIVTSAEPPSKLRETNSPRIDAGLYPADRLSIPIDALTASVAQNIKTNSLLRGLFFYPPRNAECQQNRDFESLTPLLLQTFKDLSTHGLAKNIIAVQVPLDVGPAIADILRELEGHFPNLLNIQILPATARAEYHNDSKDFSDMVSEINRWMDEVRPQGRNCQFHKKILLSNSLDVPQLKQRKTIRFSDTW